MNEIFLVMKNGKPDEIFDNLFAAQQHQKALTKKWCLTDIIRMELKSI